jgi:hypothetical protein
MTPEEKDGKTHDPESAIPPPPANPKGPAAKTGADAKPKPVFRIVPADPKNTIHFEDSADK